MIPRLQFDSRRLAWKNLVLKPRDEATLRSRPLWSMYFRYLRDYAPRMVSPDEML